MQQLEMPAHIMSHIQPLDIYFKRQWKLFAQRKSGHVQSDDIVRNLYEQSNIIICFLVTNTISNAAVKSEEHDGTKF